MLYENKTANDMYKNTMQPFFGQHYLHFLKKIYLRKALDTNLFFYNFATVIRTGGVHGKFKFSTTGTKKI